MTLFFDSPKSFKDSEVFGSKASNLFSPNHLGAEKTKIVTRKYQAEIKKKTELVEANGERYDFSKKHPLGLSVSLTPESKNNESFNKILNKPVTIEAKDDFVGDFSNFLSDLSRIERKNGGMVLTSGDKSKILTGLHANPEVQHVMSLVKKLLTTEVIMSLGFKKTMFAYTRDPMWLMPFGLGEVAVMTSKALVVIFHKGINNKLLTSLGAAIPFVGGLTPLLKLFKVDPLLAETISAYIKVRGLRIKEQTLRSEYQVKKGKFGASSKEERFRLIYLNKLARIRQEYEAGVRAGISKINKIKTISENIKGAVKKALLPAAIIATPLLAMRSED